MVSTSSWLSLESRFAAGARKEREKPHQSEAEGNKAKFLRNKFCLSFPFLPSHRITPGRKGLLTSPPPREHPSQEAGGYTGQERTL